MVEGPRLYDRAIAAGLNPTITFVSDLEIPVTGETVAVSPDALDHVSYRSRSQGIIGVFDCLPTTLDDLPSLPSDALVLVIDDLEKPGNIGALARTALAAGCHAMVTTADVDLHNPNALRASTGAIFDLPVAVSDWVSLPMWLAEQDLNVVALSPDGTDSLWNIDLTHPTALVVGSEDQGISPHSRSVADIVAGIPQSLGVVDSLNASVATGIALFEAVRQRGGH